MTSLKCTACVVLVALALCDLRMRRIPNVGVAAFAMLYWVAAAVSDAPPRSIEAHAAAGVFTLAVGALFVRLGWLAGGDAKLAATVLLWSGPTHAALTLLIISISGSIMGLSMLLLDRTLRHRPPRPWRGPVAWIACPRGVPYGVALALGGVAAVLLLSATVYGAAATTLRSSLAYPMGYEHVISVRPA